MSTTPGPAATNPEQARVLVIGEALIDAVSVVAAGVGTSGLGETETVEYVGGSPANVAFGLAALGHPVDLATWIGEDERGDRIAAVCASWGVRLTAGSTGAPFTSVAHATLDPSGAATYRFDLEWQLAAVPALGGYGHVHTGSIAAVLEPGGPAVHEALVAAHDTATVSYDPNARPTLMGRPDEARRRIEEMIAAADVVKVSDEDIAWLHPGAPIEDVIAAWAALGPSLVVVTRGSAGALVRVTGTGEVREAPAARVEVVDTVGAGDSFMAGLVSGLLDAQLLGGPAARQRLREATITDILPAVERALATSALTVAHAGAHAPRRVDLGHG